MERAVQDGHLSTFFTSYIQYFLNKIIKCEKIDLILLTIQ